MGLSEGLVVGESVGGLSEGLVVGESVGFADGLLDGRSVGGEDRQPFKVASSKRVRYRPTIRAILRTLQVKRAG